MSTWELVHLGNLVIGYIGNSFKDNFIKKICNIGVAMATPATLRSRIQGEALITV